MTIAICDTSTLIRLQKGEVLECLGQLFDKIYLPEAVVIECEDEFTAKGLKLPFFKILPVKNILPVGMGPGERAVISLAIELNIKTVISDDIKAIRKADQLGLIPLASENILVLAKRANLILSVKTILDKMKKAGEGIEDDIYFDTLRRAGEMKNELEKDSPS